MNSKYPKSSSLSICFDLISYGFAAKKTMAIAISIHHQELDARLALLHITPGAQLIVASSVGNLALFKQHKGVMVIPAGR